MPYRKFEAFLKQGIIFAFLKSVFKPRYYFFKFSPG